MIKTNKKQLNFLIDLQKAENEFRKIKKILDVVDNKIIEIEKKNDDLLSELKEKEKEYEATNLAYEEIKKTSEINEERIKKSSEDIKIVQTNKEYQTLLREIDENKKRQSHFEDEIIKFMESMEETERIIEELKKNSEQLREKTKAEKEEIEQEAKKEKKELISITRKTKKISKEIDDKIFENFQQILSQKGDIALAHVENYICYGCFMSIPPQICVDLKKGDNIGICPHCHRMIYNIEKKNDSAKVSKK